MSLKANACPRCLTLLPDHPGELQIHTCTPTPLVQNLETALRGLMTNPSIDLEDKVYDVREREGLGWDGPDVVAWGVSIMIAKALLGLKR